MQYLKSQFIPKNNKLKVIYGILWILEPGFMALIITVLLIKNRKK